MKKILTYILVLGFIITTAYGVWWWMQTSTRIDDGSASDVLSNKNEYRNEEWGFGFEYPEGWKIREPAFGSTVSLFNFVIGPLSKAAVPDPIILNISPKSWGESVLLKIDNSGVDRTTHVVAGRESSYHLSEDMGIPMHSYFILIDDAYWINITGKTAYEKELQQVLDSFYFIE